ncbi:MAG: type II secretion system protein [bacterium]
MIRISNQRGYAFVMVIAAAAILAILVGVTSVLTSYEVRHDKEMELLFRGLAYERAIQAYYLASPPGQTHTYPRQLADLLSDPRFIHQRYMRMLYPDPFGTDWSLVRSSDGGIAGVASQCQEKPIKQDNFPPAFQSFAGAAHYSDWIFMYQPGTVSDGVTAQTAR